MRTYLVTGAAGFIGANYLKYMLKKYDDVRIVVLDLLTYAGYLGTIADDIDNERCFFVKGDICDRSLIDRLFADYRFDVVVNFAAESHVDRSIENPQLYPHLASAMRENAVGELWPAPKNRKEMKKAYYDYMYGPKLQ